MKKLLYTIHFLLAYPIILFAQNPPVPDFIILESKILAKVTPLKNDGKLALVNELAEKHLDSGPFSVINKKQLPPSGDIHDYTSMGPYWWPDPEKADGLPYIRKDGEINPEYYDYKDKEDLGKLMVSLTALAEGFYYTGNEKFASHAIKLIRTWFLDPDTKMNPNLEYAQRIPGRTEGRGIGIIDTRRFSELPDLLLMLAASDHWTESDNRGINQWLSDYLDWLVNSNHGRDEAVHGNNHTTWYFGQTLPLAVYLGQNRRADSLAAEGIPLILDKMIVSDGSQPLELARTKSWDYSAMNLLGIMTFAKACEHLGRNLWDRKNDYGVGIKDALDFMIPFATGQKAWDYDQISDFDGSKLQSALYLGALKYQEKKYLDWAKKLPTKNERFNYWDEFEIMTR